MEWWSNLSDFWRGFICGGIVVPLVIVIIEIIIKLVIHGKVSWK